MYCLRVILSGLCFSCSRETEFNLLCSLILVLDENLQVEMKRLRKGQKTTRLKTIQKDQAKVNTTDELAVETAVDRKRW